MRTIILATHTAMTKPLRTIILPLLVLLVTTRSFTQNVLPIPDNGWRLWLDRSAQWENDTIFLPTDVDLHTLPVHPPTIGWKRMERDSGITVTLPSTLEEHFWGATGLRPYKGGEYAFEEEDTAVQNGNYLGVSWWVRDVYVPPSFSGKKVLLTIRGARLRAEVYLNRQLIGYNIITETAFTCDASGAIRPGRQNVLAIRITNPGGRLDWVDTELLTWGKTNQQFHKSHGFGGLDRGITLAAHDPVYISDLWALNRPEPRTLRVCGRIMNTTREQTKGTILIQLLDPDLHNSVRATASQSIRLDPSGESEFQTSIAFPAAQLWSNDHPKLYRIRARVRQEETKGKHAWTDARELTTGFRWFATDGIGSNAVLRFNGQRIRLTSAISWGFWGINGLWPTRELAEREVRSAKTLGLNALQFHRNIGKAEALDAADRLGFMRYMEPGGGQTALGDKFLLYAPSPEGPIDDSGTNGDAQTFHERYMEEKIIRMIRDHRSHPSLLLYCIQNEIHPDLRNPRIFRLLRRMHTEDPSRIVVLKSGFPSGNPCNEAWMEPYSDVVHHDTGDAYCGWWDDHTVGGPGVWRDDLYRSPWDFTHRSTNEKEIVMWGEMLGAAVPDNHAAMVREVRRLGGKSYDLGDHISILDHYNRFIDRWGFQHAFPTADALFTAIGNKSYDFWGRVIETARLAEANDYFVISGWESTAIENHSGLVDNLREFKGDPTLMTARLAPRQPVIRTASIVCERDNGAKVDLFLLNETHRAHSRGMSLEMVSPDGDSLRLGFFGIPAYAEDRFVYPVARGIALPDFSKEGIYTLRATLSGDRPAVAEEHFLVVDSVGHGSLPQHVGILSMYPLFQKPFEPLPNVRVEPYRAGTAYDMVISANRFIQPAATKTDDTTRIAGTEDPELYRTINYGEANKIEFMFAGLPPGAARVTLKFAELFQNAEGLRVFDVALNDSIVLKHFDVFKAAGGKNIAIDSSFRVDIPHGILHITFPNVPKPSARICAIKIEAGDRVIAVNCGGNLYRDKTGLVWKPYEPPEVLTPDVLEQVRKGTPLLILSEGEASTAAYGQALQAAGAIRYLGTIGEARASWMGSWYFVRAHPVFDGLPVDCAMTSYYQVPVDNSGALLVDGDGVEVFTGYSRDHDRNIGAASFTAPLGKGTVLFHSLPGVISGLNGRSLGMNPVLLKRLIANSMRFLYKPQVIH
jgi:beta-galactosidase